MDREIYLKIIMLWVLFPLSSMSMGISCMLEDTVDLKLVAFGNSITAERATVNQVFAQRLPQLLAREGIHVSVYNAGIPGSHTGRRKDHQLFKIPHALDRFETEVLNKQPDLVTIGFGTNDAFIDSKVKGGDSRIPLADYQENLVYMIEKLQNQGAQIVLIAPNILGSNYGKFQNQRMLQYVKVIRKLAKKYMIGLQDNYRLFLDYTKKTGRSYEELMLDGCHPNDQGHALIAQSLSEVIVDRIALKKK